MRRFSLLAFALSCSFLFATVFAGVADASRVEDLVDIRGVRENQLIGYGLVVGLNGTGDSGQARFTLQSTAAMLRRLGATIDPGMIQTKNAAAVMITATLPAHANPGTHLDVTVSSLGNARSLLGGTLLQTPLHGADREVYAVAQGSVVIGGFSAGGNSGSSVSYNHVTAGRVPRGAIVERPVAMDGLDGRFIFLSLRTPSFTNASRIATVIEADLGENMAAAQDGGTVRVRVPDAYRDNRVGLVAHLQALDVQASAPSRVVIDERTGTIVLGAGVEISEVAIAQGGLTIEVSERVNVTQPEGFAGGDTAVTPETEIRAEAGGGSMAHVTPTADLADVVAALNALGASPRDLIAIFQALHTAGALRAEIQVQ
ncbi:MAG: flagellar P-ring protein precursor FlgI [Polyangiales bacterium]|jgi:flagellar P-ring protein precursor FlgI